MIWTVSLFDKDIAPIMTEGIKLNELSGHWKNGHNFSFHYQLPKISDSTYELRMYIYNPNRQKYAEINVDYDFYRENEDL